MPKVLRLSGPGLPIHDSGSKSLCPIPEPHGETFLKVGVIARLMCSEDLSLAILISGKAALQGRSIRGRSENLIRATKRVEAA